MLVVMRPVCLYPSPRPRPEPKLGSLRVELLSKPVLNIYMVLASNVCVCSDLACVACTAASATAAARALCSKVLHVSDLVLNECL